MKLKNILTLLIGFCSLLSVRGATDLPANQRALGFTQGDNIEIEGATFGEAGTYPIGAELGPSVLGSYAGCRVVGIRMAAAMDLGRTRFFLYRMRDGQPEELHSQKQSVYSGWNNVYFNGDGFEIEPEDDLFFGFEYVETEEMVRRDIGGLCSAGNDSTGAFLLYSNGRFYPVSGVGALCVQLIVDISSLPADRLSITYFDTGFKYKPLSEPLEIFYTVCNTGRRTADTWRIACVLDNMQPEYFEFPGSIAPGESESDQRVIPFPAEIEIGMHSVRLYVDAINGEELTEPRKMETEISEQFAIYDRSMDRRSVYLETYSSQTDTRSAALDNLIPDLQDNMGETLSVVKILDRNSALNCSEGLWFYDLYAYTSPCFSMNRSLFPGEAHVAYDLNDFIGLLPDPMLVGILEDIAYQDLASPCFADLELSVDYDPATRRVKAIVEGEALPEARAIFGDLAVTLMLTEDNVKGGQRLANGMGSVNDPGYMHQNLLRGFMTSPRGDRLEWLGLSHPDLSSSVHSDNALAYCAQFESVLPENWKSGDMKVVALLTKALPAEGEYDVRSSDVLNAMSAPVPRTDGIKETWEVPLGSLEELWFTLDGKRISAPSAPGLYLFRDSSGRTHRRLIR